MLTLLSVQTHIETVDLNSGDLGQDLGAGNLNLEEASETVKSEYQVLDKDLRIH